MTFAPPPLQIRMTLSTETDKWQELMGTDLCMKILRHQDVDGEEEDAHHYHHDDEEQSVQLHDIVEIDWIGYYCDDAIKLQLGIPPTASPSDLVVNNESPPIAGTTTPSPSHDNQNHIETDTTKTTSSSVLLSILNECPIFHSVQNLYCDVGDQDVIPAVEMGLRFLHVVVRRSRREPNRSLPEMVDETEEPGIIILPTVALIYSHSKYAYGISSRTFSTIIASGSASATTTTTPATTTTTATTTGTHRNHDSYTLPSLSNVIYKVTLKRIVSSSTATEGSPNILLQLFKCKKHLANDIYQNDILATKKTRDETTTTANASHNHNNSYHCHRAVRIYQRTVERLENWMLELQNATDDNGDDDDDDDPVKHHDRMEARDNIAAITATASYIQEAQQLQIDCLNNISAVYLKCRLYHKAKEACIETLLKDANNSKALIRAAKAALYDPASSYEEVQAAFRAVQDIATMADDDATLQKDLNALQKEYVHHQAKYKREQKQMAVRIQEKLLTNRRRPKQPQQPRESSTDGTTNPASPARRTRSTITEQDDNTRETKPTTTTATTTMNPRQHPTLHNNDTEKTVWTTWFGRHIQLFTNVPNTTTELLCSAILPILVLWILCLYGFMGYLLYTQK